MKIYLSLILLFGFSLNLFADDKTLETTAPISNISKSEYNHEFYGAWGMLTILDFINVFNGMGASIGTGIASALTGSSDKFNYDSKSIGAFTAGYNYYITRRWSIGADSFYQKINVKERTNDYVERYSYTGYGVLGKTDFKWASWKYVQTYAGLGIGVWRFQRDRSTYSDAEDRVRLALHFCLFGIRFGNSFGGFFEFGFGMEGLLKFGASVKF